MNSTHLSPITSATDKLNELIDNIENFQFKSQNQESSQNSNGLKLKQVTDSPN